MAWGTGSRMQEGALEDNGRSREVFDFILGPPDTSTQASIVSSREDTTPNTPNALQTRERFNHILINPWRGYRLLTI